jgi:hypothetical protein
MLPAYNRGRAGVSMRATHRRRKQLEKTIEQQKGQLALALAVLASLGFDLTYFVS